MTLLSAVIGIIWAYRGYKRRGAPRRPLPSGVESSERLERLEHGMEAIAIEIERVSEGQRFVTKLLSESRAQAVPSDKLPS